MTDDIPISSAFLGLMEGRGVSGHHGLCFSFSRVLLLLEGLRMVELQGSSCSGMDWRGLVWMVLPQCGSCSVPGGLPVPRDPTALGRAGRGPYLVPAGWA